eukprot:jgi/Mesvir1/9961/Mv05753-RA.1
MIANAVVRQAVRIPSRVLRSVTCRPRSPRVVVIDVDAVRSRALPPGGLDAQEGEGAGRGRQKHLEKVPATDAAAEKVTTNFTLVQAGVPTETRQAHTYSADAVTVMSKKGLANTTGVPITFTTGKASISNGALILPGGATPTTNAAATAANVPAFPTGTQSYEISFNISYNGVPVSGATTVRRLFSYGTLICNWYGDGKIEATAGGVTLATPVNTLAMAASTQKKYKVTMRRTYVDAPLNSLSTFEIFVDGVQKSVSTGTGLATHSLSSPALVLGNDGTGYLVPLTFDDVRIELVSPPTNVNADGAGLVVAGDGAINSKAAERSITWKKNVAQELGDNTGSYWHIKGGQLMFSRLIDTTKRKAPGTNVLLSSLPIKGASTESNMWTLATNGTATTGSAVLTYTSTPPGTASHTAGGYFQTNYGNGTVTVSYYSATNIGRTTTGYDTLVTGIVKPFTSLSTATGGDVGTGAGAAMTAPFLCGVANSTNTNVNMAELLTIGKDGTAGSYVSVWAWRGGRLLMFTGNHYTETSGIVVGASEFVLGVLLSSTGPVLYVNGTPATMTTAGWRTITANASFTGATGVSLSATGTERGIYLGARSAYPANPANTNPFNIGFKNWRVVDTLAAGGSTATMSSSQIMYTQLYRYADEYDSEPLMVTYGFRIGDDETLQIVKTQGSATTTTLLGNPMPASDNISGTALDGNSMGTVEDGTVNVVLELLNKVS